MVFQSVFSWHFNRCFRGIWQQEPFQQTQRSAPNNQISSRTIFHGGDGRTWSFEIIHPQSGSGIKDDLTCSGCRSERQWIRKPCPLILNSYDGDSVLRDFQHRYNYLRVNNLHAIYIHRQAYIAYRVDSKTERLHVRKRVCKRGYKVNSGVISKRVKDRKQQNAASQI